MMKWDEGRYTITMKNGEQATIYLKKMEAKALFQKFAWLRILGIHSVEYSEIQ